MLKKCLIRSSIIVLGALMFWGCKQQIKTAAWNTTLFLPLAKTQLSIYNLLPDSILSKDSTNLVSLVYRTNLYSYNKSSQIHIPDTTIQYNFKLDSIKLSDKSLNFGYSLGKLLLSLGPVGTIIIASNGGSSPIPADNITTPTTFPIDAQSFFHNATLRQGFMDLQLTNDFPVELDSIKFELRNKSDNSLILSDSIPQLGVSRVFSKTYDLKGKTVEGLMVGGITHLYTPGSGGGNVPIDTSKGLSIFMKVYKMKVQKATAIFPAQNLVTDSADAPYNITGGVKLKYVILRHGSLTIKAVSTIKDTLHFEYTLPHVTDTLGNIIYIKDVVPPAPSSGNTFIKRRYDLTGFKVDLTGKNRDTINTFSHSLVLHIDSTGIIRTLSLSDSLYIYYSLDSLIPQYAEGNLGTDVFNYTGGVKFDFFKRLRNGKINLKNAKVNVNFTNYIGADGSVKINSLTGKNSATGVSVPLTSPLFAAPLAINRATQTQPFLVNNKLDYSKLNPTSTSLSINGTNSSIVGVFNNLPDSFTYSLTTLLNPNYNPKWYGDFVYDDRSLNVNMDIKVPLSLVARNITLEDTVAANLGALAFEANSNKNGITDALMYLLVDNGFPIKSQVQVYFYTASYALVDSLFNSPQIVQAAPTNSACYVSAPARTALQTQVNQLRLNKLKAATHAIIKTTFNTVGTGACNGQPLNIFSDYKFNVSLTARLTYHFARK